MKTKCLTAQRSTTPLVHPKYRPDIDGLRAIAILAVVIFHTFPGKMPGGFIGVDIFFVISGYLISAIIFSSLERNRFSLVEFYVRRVRRIFPALILVLISCLAFGWFVLLADEYKQLGKHTATGAGFIQNFVLWRESGYFDNSVETKPLLHLWSLAIEEQFYFFWPLLLAFVWKRQWSFLRITAIIAAVSFAANIYLILSGHPTAAFYLPFSRFWELMVGGVLAYVVLHRPQLIEKHKDAQSFMGFALILAGLLLLNKGRDFPGWWALLPTMGAFFIISAGPSSWLNEKLLANKPMVWIGLISYPLYLWHWPLLSFARILKGGAASVKIRVAAVVISIALAWLTYRLIEKPIRFGKHNTIQIIALLVLMIVAGYMGYDGYKRDRHIDTNPINQYRQNQEAFAWPDEKNKTNLCENEVKTNAIPYCLISKGEDNNLTTALIGDSHANAIFDFVNAKAKENGSRLIMLGSAGCPPFLGVERDKSECPKKMDAVVNYINSNRNIQNVIITGRFAATLSGVNFGGETLPNFYTLTLVQDASIKDREAIFQIGLENIVRALSEKGKKITILLDLPELNFDPKSCLETRGNNQCIISRNVVDDRQKYYTQIIRRLQVKYNFAVIDLKPAFCKSELCIAKYDERILYRDSHHLGINGNAFLVNSGFELPGIFTKNISH
jgi:peptidoglycan/LPS O-acetylase OafA/YrhL